MHEDFRKQKMLGTNGLTLEHLPKLSTFHNSFTRSLYVVRYRHFTVFVILSLILIFLLIFLLLLHAFPAAKNIHVIFVELSTCI